MLIYRHKFIVDDVTDKETELNENHTENSLHKVDANKNNSDTPALNVNHTDDIVKKQINILQIYTLNANFYTKVDELVEAMAEHESDIVIVSESNIEHNEPNKLEERVQKLKNFNIEDKEITGQDKA